MNRQVVADAVNSWGADTPEQSAWSQRGWKKEHWAETVRGVRRAVLALGQVLDVQQHGVLLRPQLVSYQEVGHQLGAQSWKTSKAEWGLTRGVCPQNKVEEISEPTSVQAGAKWLPHPVGQVEATTRWGWEINQVWLLKPDNCDQTLHFSQHSSDFFSCHKWNAPVSFTAAQNSLQSALQEVKSQGCGKITDSCD